MIRINRPALVPRVLTTRGKTRRRQMEQEYDAAPQEYDARTRRFSFAGDVYGHPTVKEALVEAQHRKCCFCEQKTGMDGDVEHFRPKAGFSQGAGGPIEGPGYFWLAYEWTNLLLACAICNQRFKRNLFPLLDPSQRARSHHHDPATEAPLFINPCDTDPEELIGFRREIPYPINNDPRAVATIKALGLDREILNERRRDRLRFLAEFHHIVQLARAHPQNAQLQTAAQRASARLADAVLDAAEFAAMARCASKAGYYLDR